MPSLNNIAKEVSLRTGIPASLILSTYKTFWEYLKNKISNQPLKENLSEEDFNSLQLNFHLPYIGKLYCTYDDYLKTKASLKYKSNDRHKYKENKTDV